MPQNRRRRSWYVEGWERRQAAAAARSFVLLPMPFAHPSPFLHSRMVPQIRRKKRRLDEVCLELRPEHSRNVIQSWIVQGAPLLCRGWLPRSPPLRRCWARQLLKRGLPLLCLLLLRHSCRQTCV